MLKLYQETLIGYQETGISTFGLYGQDTEVVYKQNLQTQPITWLYRDKSVIYNRNSYGHRSKEINQLNENFILFIGCSITVGSAVSLEDTFPHIVSKQLDIDYYNLAVEGAGPDLITYNIANWLNQIKKIPAAVVIQWPEIYRTFRQNGNAIIPIGPWSCKNDIGVHITKQQWADYEKQILTDYFDHCFFIYKMTVLAVLKSYSVSVVEIENFPVIDVGRDLKHPGINSHQQIANQVLLELKKLINFGQ